MTPNLERIAVLRGEADMTQQELADALGIKLRRLQEWEQGNTEPDTDHLIKIAHYFHTSTDWLLGRPGRKSVLAFNQLQEVVAELNDEEIAALTEYARFLLSRR